MAAPKGKQAGKKNIGRPPFDWTPEIEEEILGRIMLGESVAKICGPDRDDWTPSERTFYSRLLSDDEFSQRYARAREMQAETLAGQILDIADDASGDWIDGENGPRPNPENTQRSRLRVDARKWMAAKLAPKKYGDKVAVGGADDLPPLKTSDADPNIVAALAKKLLD